MKIGLPVYNFFFFTSSLPCSDASIRPSPGSFLDSFPLPAEKTLLYPLTSFAPGFNALPPFFADLFSPFFPPFS